MRLTAFFFILLLTGCTQSVLDAKTSACAETVRLYLELPASVIVRGTPLETPDGEVEIQYESFNRENIPVTGAATCQFIVTSGASTLLQSANIDGMVLGAEEIANINSSL